MHAVAVPQRRQAKNEEHGNHNDATHGRPQYAVQRSGFATSRPELPLSHFVDLSRPSGPVPTPRRSGEVAGLRTGGLAGAIVRLRFVVIAFWVLALLSAIPGAIHVSDVLQVQGGGLRESESQRADRELRSRFERPVAAFFAVTVRGRVPVDNPDYSAFLDTLVSAAAAQPYI